MIRYKVTSTHVNPAYLPLIQWVDTKEQAEAIKAKESPLAVTEVMECEIPDAIFDKIKERLSDSEQFCEMNSDDQFEEIFNCYRKMLCSMNDFYDSRYAY